MFPRMPGQRDTQYSQFDSRRRINGNARLLEGGNSLNSLFLRLLHGEADNGPRAWLPLCRLAGEGSTRAHRHRVGGSEGSGRTRHDRVTCPTAPLLYGPRRDRRAKHRACVGTSCKLRGCRECRIARIGSGCSEPPVVQPWRAATPAASGSCHGGTFVPQTLGDKRSMTINCNVS